MAIQGIRRRGGVRAKVALCALLTPLIAQGAEQALAPVTAPPLVKPELGLGAGILAFPLAGAELPGAEWTYHKSADGLDPSAEEQKMLWLMNRARQDPTAEGIWLAAMDDADVAFARVYFEVDVDTLRAAFAALAAKPPAAFDIRLHDASVLHSEALIDRDAQDHDGQVSLIGDSGFSCNGLRASVFSYTRSALYGHAALNIDWGYGPDGMQSPPGHRYAIMGEWSYSGAGLTNVGLALVAEDDPLTDVGPLVFSGAYCQGSAAEHNRFIVGTVWDDLDSDEVYDEGEGLAGVTVTPDSGSYFAVTGAAGGYAIPITTAGDYSVTFTGGDLAAAQIVEDITVGANSVLLDVIDSGLDSDDDGVTDRYDAFPYDPDETLDSDEDGVGDNADVFPYDASETQDSDDDGVGDNGDAFPNDPDEWADSDGDGIGDNADEFPLGHYIDVAPGHPAFDVIELLADNALTAGCSEDSFCPGTLLTRAQLAVTFFRALYGVDADPPAASGEIFADISQSHPAADYIEQLFADGISAGCAESLFCPDATVTRATLAVLLLRLKHGYDYIPPAADGSFDDVPVSDIRAPWVEQLAAEEISAGCGDNLYCPSQAVSRQQFALLLARTLEL